MSIVAVPWRRFCQAARWNGHPPQTTTGAASVSDSHCQLSNCSGGIIAISRTGSVSSADSTSRVVSGSASGSGAAWGSVAE